MAKGILNISNYSGGLNNKTNPRDIDDNQFQVLDSLSIETPGKLKIMGAAVDYASQTADFATPLTYGNGLFQFNADYDIDDTTAFFENNEFLFINTSKAETSPAQNSGLVKVFKLNDVAYGTKTFTYGDTYSPVTYNAVDGVVRITPTEFNEGNKPIKIKHVNEEYNLGFKVELDVGGILFSNTSTANNDVHLADGDTLITGSTEIVHTGTHAFNVGDSIKLKKVSTGSFPITFFSNPIIITGYNATTKTITFSAYSGSYFFSTVDSDVEIYKWDGGQTLFAKEVGWKQLNTELPDVTTNEVVVHNNTSELLSNPISTFVSITSEVIPVLTPASTAGFVIGDIIKINSEYMKISYVAASTLTVTRGLWGTSGSHTNGDEIQLLHRAVWGETFSIPSAQVSTDILFAGNGTSGRGPFHISLWVGDRATTNGNLLPTDDSGTFFSTTEHVVTVYSEIVYLDGQRSQLKLEKVLTSSKANQSINVNMFGRVPNLSNIKSVKLYYNEHKGNYSLTNSSQVEPAEDYAQNKIKYLLFEIDFRKGIRYAAGKDYYNAYPVLHSVTDEKSFFIYPSSLAALISLTGFTHVSLGSIKLKDKPENVSAEVYIKLNEFVLGGFGTGYKTSTVANRRLYVGNVSYTDPVTKELKTANDTIFKSSVNAFDTFSFENRIDVEINDGDDIIALESLGSKLLEFKRNHLYVINIARDIEFLEATLEYKGCEKDYHVVRGEGFIAWFNKFGFYLYDGKQIRDLLLDKNGQQRLVWDSYYNDNNVIGYDPTQKNIYLLTGSATAGNKQTLLSYDLKSRGISFRSKATIAKDITNIVNDNEGKMLWMEEYNASNVELRKLNILPSKLNQASDGTNGLNIDEMALKTKEFTFGKPSVDKKIISVYLSYKNGDGAYLYGFTDNGTEEILATLDGSSEVDFKTLHIPIRKAKTEFVDKKAFDKIKGFGLRLSGSDVATDFEINDIQIIFREKSVK